MSISFTNVLIFFLVSSLFSFSTIRSAMKEILLLNLGRKYRNGKVINEKHVKHKYRKLVGNKRLIERVFISYAKDYHHNRKLLSKILVTLNYIYIYISLLFLLLMLLYFIQPNTIVFLEFILKVKMILIDLPLLVFYILKYSWYKGRVNEWKL